jgi:hypothetical protein
MNETWKVQNTVQRVNNKPAKQLMPTSAAIADLDKKVVSQLMSTKDEKLVSATRFFRIADDGVPPANQST